jgi:hypothetical protein
MTIVMVSGHTDLTDEEFNKYYKPYLDEYVELKYSFLVGGAQGCDEMTQKYLSDKDVLVTVYDKGVQCNVYNNKYNHINGFDSYPLRDKAMTENSDIDLAFPRQNGGGGSGTWANILRRKYGDVLSSELIKLAREKFMKYVL